MVEGQRTLKTRKTQIIDVSEWDRLVSETYGRVYDFQQQDGCRDRGTYEFTVPFEEYETYLDTVPEQVNHDEMCVNFQAWLR